MWIAAVSCLVALCFALLEIVYLMAPDHDIFIMFSWLLYLFLLWQICVCPFACSAVVCNKGYMFHVIVLMFNTGFLLMLCCIPLAVKLHSLLVSIFNGLPARTTWSIQTCHVLYKVIKFSLSLWFIVFRFNIYGDFINCLWPD